jgi:cardiolipin-specific phospholipase
MPSLSDTAMATALACKLLRWRDGVSERFRQSLWQNMGAFASVPNTRVHFIDWLGVRCLPSPTSVSEAVAQMGRSGRPPFPSIKQKANTQAAMQERVTAAEAFFGQCLCSSTRRAHDTAVDSLEEFRRKNNIEKMTLVGHSIGGYINSAYSIKYPERINRLVLISPAGVPKSPYRSNLKDDSDATPQEQKQTADAFAEEVMPASSAGAELPEAPKTWWSYLWEQGSLSPFSLLRASSFMAPSLMSRYANRRFSSFDADTQRDL